MKGIYKITSPTGRIYIGQSIDIHKRRRMYVNNHCHKQQKLYASLCKYGFALHDFEIIEECNEIMLNEREEYWISYYNTFNDETGMNLSSGGLNKRVSEETKAKISAGNKGRVRPDLSERNKLGIGKKLNKEMIEKMRINSTGKKHSPETILKMKSSALKRGPRSDETKNKMSESGKKKILTPEHKEKLRIAKIGNINYGKKVINIETGEVFCNLATLCREKDLNYGVMKPKMRGAKKNNTIYKYL